MTHLTETWPSIPLPVLDYSGIPRNATIGTAAEEMTNARRSRFEKSYAQINVRWIFNASQYSSFRVFFKNNLGQGNARFGIQLRYPLNSALAWWDVRFIGGFNATYEEGFWTVGAQLDLIQTYTP